MTVVTEREFREAVDSLGLNPDKGDWDSIKHFNLVMELEARWGARIPIEDVEKLKTFSDFYFRIPCRPGKVLAVDADNTLWKGIVSEDGAESVVPYVEFQNGIKQLRSRGVMLALLSKNDIPNGGDSPIERAFARDDMPLKITDFAFVGVNWEPKAGNLIAAAKTLNVGVDSFVFVDDNPHERAQMAAHVPSVMVIGEMERWLSSGMCGLAQEIGNTYFADAGKTEEDILRANRPSQSGGAVLGDVAFSKKEYLETLQMEVAPSVASEADIPRLAQMAGKTNQFNATTIRRTESDFGALLADGTKKVFVFRLSDRFGPMGIVCYVVVDLAAKRITDFVMSCRAMGRTLEFFVYGYVNGMVEGCSAMEIDYLPTQKNAPFAAFMGRIKEGESATYCRQA
ncbi:MAG: HAD-IIIC family phosphatase [Kiritimatiellae bacterium]|nr:HAD-IIIC family phosphatase [Kiritimatiellia bacterium]